MDLLTYALAKQGIGSGALTGLTDIAINDDGQLVFTISGREEPIVTSTAIPAASSQDILDALSSHPDTIKQALDIPAALTNESYADIQDIVSQAVTSFNITIPNGENDPIIITLSDRDSDDPHSLTLPLATGDMPGLVRGISVSEDPSEEEENENMNKILINEDGTMSIYSLNVNKLVQTEGEEMVIGDID